MRSRSSQRTPEWPRINEFMRMSIAARTHDSGIERVLSGSERGKGASGLSSAIYPGWVNEGRIPDCWCWRSAFPSAKCWLVRVSAER